MEATIHKTVLLKEAILGLDLDKKKNPAVLDATFGGGGHSLEILKNYPEAKVVALDQDKSAWERSKERFKGMEERIFFININFRDLDTIFPSKVFFGKNFLKKNSSGLTLPGVPGGTHTVQNFFSENFIDAVIFDLGLSSDQLESSGRGFTFTKDEPLLMNMKEDIGEEDLIAEEIVNNWDEENIRQIIEGYGEERFARRIAKGIREAREKKRIKTTGELVQVIQDSVPDRYRRGKIHFATRTFQALRIAVNDELGALTEGLEKSFDILNEDGRMSVISFHSLEDRIVKNFYKNKQKENKAKIITKKPVSAGEEEIIGNRRSRSAKLRILEKIVQQTYDK